MGNSESRSMLGITEGGGLLLVLMMWVAEEPKFRNLHDILLCDGDSKAWNGV
jgi:hypothetical protein